MAQLREFVRSARLVGSLRGLLGQIQISRNILRNMPCRLGERNFPKYRLSGSCRLAQTLRPLRASKNFEISGAQKPKSLKNRALRAPRRPPWPAKIEILADDNGKNEDPAKMTYSIPDFVSRNYSVSEEISRNIPRFEEKYERNK